MKIRRARLILSIALSFIVGTSFGAGIRRAGAQESKKLTFEMLSCGIGMFESHQIYKVSDGTTLNVDLVSYSSEAKAKKALAKELKVVRRIDERKEMRDANGKKIGERIIAIVSVDGIERTLLISLEGNTLYKIDAPSLSHIEQFQSSDRS